MKAVSMKNIKVEFIKLYGNAQCNSDKKCCRKLDSNFDFYSFRVNSIICKSSLRLA